MSFARYYFSSFTSGTTRTITISSTWTWMAVRAAKKSKPSEATSSLTVTSNGNGTGGSVSYETNAEYEVVFSTQEITQDTLDQKLNSTGQASVSSQYVTLGGTGWEGADGDPPPHPPKCNFDLARGVRRI